MPRSDPDAETQPIDRSTLPLGKTRSTFPAPPSDRPRVFTRRPDDERTNLRPMIDEETVLRPRAELMAALEAMRRPSAAPAVPTAMPPAMPGMHDSMYDTRTETVAESSIAPVSVARPMASPPPPARPWRIVVAVGLVVAFVASGVALGAAIAIKQPIASRVYPGAARALASGVLAGRALLPAKEPPPPQACPVPPPPEVRERTVYRYPVGMSAAGTGAGMGATPAGSASSAGNASPSSELKDAEKAAAEAKEQLDTALK